MRKAGVAINPNFIEIDLESGEARYLADRYFDLSVGRTSTGFGVGPLTWADLDAYCRMRRTRFTNWEIDLLRVMDGYFCLNANNKEKE